MFHIIDDDEPILEFFSELIEEMGYEVKPFSCPLDYLSYVNSSEYVLPIAVISDISMPKMNGFEMLEKVRKKHPDIRAAVVSGYFENRARAKVNACVYLHKPTDFNSIMQMVETFACCHENGPHPEEYQCNAEAGKWDCPHASHCKSSRALTAV
ncbi:MAG: response regulator [Mariprofundaceae bacterium]